MAITRALSFALIFILVTTANSFAGDIEQAEQFYNQGCALASVNPEEAVTNLKKSIEIEPSFAAYYMLASTLLQLGDNGAENYFEIAFRLSENDSDQGLALVGVGEALAVQGDVSQGLQVIKAGITVHPAPTERMMAVKTALENENAHRVIPAAEIRNCLDPQLLAKGVSVTPKINLPVRFEFDSFELNEKGRRQTEQLAVVLKNDSRQFKVIGHTDAQGDEAYNQNLSEQRARAVINYLEQLLPGISSRLNAIGMGESLPIRYQMNAQAHMVNRRVEVEVYK